MVGFGIGYSRIIPIFFPFRYLCCSRVKGGIWEGADEGAAGRLCWPFLNGSPAPLLVRNNLWKPIPSRYSPSCPHEMFAILPTFCSQPTPVQMTEHSKNSPTPIPTWTTWWQSTTRRPPVWRTCPRPTLGKAPTRGSTYWSTTSGRDPAHCVVWETSGGKLSTAVWSVPVGVRSTSGCM